MTKEFNYIIDLFNKIYKPEFKIDINYGIIAHSKIQIKKTIIPLFERNWSEINSNSIIWKEWHGEQIPFFEETDT